MNRIDRLTAMILMLQSQRVITAEQMAEHFALSVRTIYRGQRRIRRPKTAR